MSAPGTLLWFARHELRLAWRDWLAMMTAGRRVPALKLMLALAAAAAVMHAIAYAVVPRFAGGGSSDKTVLVVITGSIFLTWSLMLSQAMERVTRGFYTRGDLELLLSSPVASDRVFFVRLAAIAVSVIAMGVLIAGPFINVLAIEDGPHWLTAYVAVVAVGAAAAAGAILVSVVLFELIGPKRTRLVAQIVAGVIGAGFVIALQFAVISSTGTLPRFSLFASAPILAMAPGVDNPIYWPAKAVLGDPIAVAGLIIASLVALIICIALVAPRVVNCVVAAAGLAHPGVTSRTRTNGFRAASAVAILRRKEWLLLLRDPWLASQTLMQMLYLLPPAFLLWRSFSDHSDPGVLLVPVLVMAAGQLAGGLAWLTISGEDAPALIMTAPLASHLILRAKVEAIIGAVAMVFVPFLIALALLSPVCAAIGGASVMLAAASSTYIQLCFRSQAKRSNFRRRHTSSQIATFAEAFASIAWAGAAALAATGKFAVAGAVPALFALAVLGTASFVGRQHARRSAFSGAA